MTSGSTQVAPGAKTAALALAGVAVLANACGYLFGIWSRVDWFDEVVHFYSTFALTLLLGAYLYGVVLTGANTAPLRLVLAIASVGIAIGALWEVAEWSYDRWFAAGNAILGKPDTMFDLVLDTAGALLGGAVAVVLARRPFPQPGAGERRAPR